MNWQHLKAILWLRWRLTVNQWKKGGAVNAVIGLILLILGLFTSVTSFFASFAIGLVVFPKAEPDHLLLMWDLIVVLFLFFWIMGLVTELQRSEALSFDKLLHLPISLSGTFLLNYLSSLVSLSLIVFIPTAVGLCAALTVVKGPAMLVQFALLASFVLMITAITHQFRGWLFLLMVNKRRRRTIIAVVTAVFILLVQLPNVMNVMFQRGRKSDVQREHDTAVQQLQQELSRGEISPQHFNDQVASLKKERDEKRKQQRMQIYRRVVDITAVASMVVPVGWLGYGARAAAGGNIVPGLLGTLGALVIGVVSLRRSYRSTLQYYKGGFNATARKPTEPVQWDPSQPVSNFLERRIVRVPDQAAAVAWGGFRSLMRAPEGKMLLLTPLILLAFFGAMFFMGRERHVPEMVRPMVGLGAISVTMLCFVQLLCNMFGFDRDGFRAFVLSPCRRQDILLGKNLSVTPLVFGVSCLALVIVQILLPMQISHFLASMVQVGASFAIYCVLGNLISIIAPSAITAGSLKPAKAKFLTIVIHIIAATLSPLVLVPAFIALGIELLLHQLSWAGGIPIYLGLSVLELFVAAWGYRRLLAAEGRLLQRREQAILEVICSKAE